MCAHQIAQHVCHERYNKRPHSYQLHFVSAPGVASLCAKIQLFLTVFIHCASLLNALISYRILITGSTAHPHDRTTNKKIEFQRELHEYVYNELLDEKNVTDVWFYRPRMCVCSLRLCHPSSHITLKLISTFHHD